MAAIYILLFSITRGISIKFIIYILVVTLSFGLIWGLSMFAFMEIKYRLRAHRGT